MTWCPYQQEGEHGVVSLPEPPAEPRGEWAGPSVNSPLTYDTRVRLRLHLNRQTSTGDPDSHSPLVAAELTKYPCRTAAANHIVMLHPFISFNAMMRYDVLYREDSRALSRDVAQPFDYMMASKGIQATVAERRKRHWQPRR
jgi:hypothetical protein